MVGFDPYLAADAGPADLERLELPDLFARSSAVTLHLPLTDATLGPVGTELLGRMPYGSYLVNTARGGLVDVDAVLAALEAWHLAGSPSTYCQPNRRRRTTPCCSIPGR